MPRFTRLIKITFLLVIIYSLYIYVKIPSLTEGFTNDIRETIRPTVRKCRLSVDDKIKTLNTITENFKLKFGI